MTIFLQSLAFALLLAALAYLLFRIWWLEARLDVLDGDVVSLMQSAGRRPPRNAHDLDGEDYAEWTEDLGQRIGPNGRETKY